MERLYLLMWWGSPILCALLGTMSLTLLVCRLTRQRLRPLRLLPLGFLLIPLAGGVCEWKQGGFLWQLGVALWAMIGGVIFLGWLIGWVFCRDRKETR